MKKFFIYGKHPIFLALQNKKREFYEILTSNIKELNDFIDKNNIKINKNIIKYRDNKELNKITNENHQGYIAYVSEKKPENFLDFLSEHKNEKILPKLLILDQLTDPHNIGAIIRTAVAFGVKDIIITRDNSILDSATIVKSSAGMSEFVNLIEVVNLNNAIEDLKNIGYFVVGLAGEGKTNLNTINNSENLCLVVGNEGKGIRSLVKKNCDILCRIEIDSSVESLNASVATAISIYQLWGKK